MGAIDLPLPSTIRAVVFDVDGTLYDQPKLRRAMALRLAGHLLRHPFRGLKELKVIRAFRDAQERLRETSGETRNRLSADLQLEWAAASAGMDRSRAEVVVREWMFQRPLDAVRRYAYPELRAVLDRLRARGMKLGVYSDYPAEEKLTAMGVADRFDSVISSYDPAVARFKPDPAGFRVVTERLGVLPSQAVYVGDRPEVDAAGGNAAGLHAIILDPRRRFPPGDFATIRTLSELTD